MPLTVMPFFAYVLASQWTKPWRADFAELFANVSTFNSPDPTFKKYSRVMRSNYPTCDSCNTAHKHDASPTLFLHIRNTQLCQEVRRSAVDAPRILKNLSRDILHGLNARVPTRRARVVDEDGWRTKIFRNDCVELADLMMLPWNYD
jgi:hypothetical protein